MHATQTDPAQERDPLALLDLQMDTLFTNDEQGRLLTVHERGGGPAPLVFLGRTATGNRWRIAARVPETVALEIAQLLAAEPVLPAVGPDTPPVCAAALRQALGIDPARGDRVWLHAGPAWLLPATDVPATDAPPDGLLVFSEADIDDPRQELLRSHFDWLLAPGELATRLPLAVVVRDGTAVSLCCCARRTAQAAEAGLETVPAWRGQGFAVAVTRAWATAVQASGRLALYSTDWENHASQAVARKLGAVRYAEDWSLSVV